MARFFTSDTHFSHPFVANIRGFDTVEEHDESIIQSWNKTVMPDDEVWHLGDLTLKKLDRVSHLIERLHGKINLVLGNHDKAHPLNRGWQTAYGDALQLFDFVGTQASIRLEGEMILMSHFPREGDGEHSRVVRYPEWRFPPGDNFLLHGHVHSTERIVTPGHLHVGWDAWKRPISEKEIIQAVKSWREEPEQSSMMNP